MKDPLIHILKKSLKQPLPGQEAQYRMAHVVRRNRQSPPPDARMAGVLALFYPKDGDWHIVLIERATHHRSDRHSGQISFPGGRFEEGDGSLEMTALREAEEEVGVDPGQVELLGRLTELYIPVSNFLVNPFVGVTPTRPAFRPELSEVKAILEVPFQLFQKPETRQKTDLHLAENIILRNVPYFDIHGQIVWGATAMMLNELVEILNQAESQSAMTR